mmetsp:Transcript_39917/g.105594  ORF Transcript_39917/g.105594 Transcript_39917/m.105594 type:complete len:209 (+) Transcript_39917:178-804(+)
MPPSMPLILQWMVNSSPSPFLFRRSWYSLFSIRYVRISSRSDVLKCTGKPLNTLPRLVGNISWLLRNFSTSPMITSHLFSWAVSYPLYLSAPLAAVNAMPNLLKGFFRLPQAHLLMYHCSSVHSSDGILHSGQWSKSRLRMSSSSARKVFSWPTSFSPFSMKVSRPAFWRYSRMFSSNSEIMSPSMIASRSARSAGSITTCVLMGLHL